MSSAADVVRDILSEDGLIIEALQRGVLNISAYANEVHAEVESRTKKPVRIGTIIVALSRLTDKIEQQPRLAPIVAIDSMNITSSLLGISYDKTDQVLMDISRINHSYIDNANAFFAMTMGTKGVTIICSSSLADRITQSIGQHPKATMEKLVAISVRFSDDYMDVPNTIYSLVQALAVRQIHIVEIVSTYTELTFMVYEQEMETALQALQLYQKNSTVKEDRK